MRTSLVLALALSACNRETQVTPRNADPAAEILSPADGASVAAGDPVALLGSGSDPDHEASELIATWRIDETVVCQAPVSATGETACQATFLAAGDADVSLTITDPGGATDVAHIGVTVAPQGAPVVNLISPSAGDVAVSTDPVLVEATVTDDQDLPSDLTLILTSDRDGEVDFDGVPDGSGAVSAYVTLSPGPHVLTLEAIDSDDQTSRDQVAFRVNRPPPQPEIAILPDPPASGDEITVSFTSEVEDEDGDPVTFAYEWWLDGVPSAASTSATLPASATERGDVWTVRVTPSDPYEAGPYAEADVTIGNAAPTITSASLSPSPLTAADTASCGWTGFSDPDGDADASTVAWDVNGVAAGSGTLLSGGFARGDVVGCTVTPHDGADAGAPVSASVTVENSVPSIAYATIGPAGATAGDTLTCAPSGWSDADGDLDQSTYEWLLNGVLDGTAPRYTGAFADGDTVTCTITPYDGYDKGTPVSASITIDPSAPSIASVTITPDPAKAGDALTCGWTGFSDPDGDPDASTAAWTVNGVAAGAGTTLSSGYDHKDVVVCTVTPSDGTKTGTPVSDSIVISNTAPVLSAVTLSPDAAYEGDTLVCTPGATSDADGTTAFTYTYAWDVSGSDPGVTSSSLPSSRWKKGDDVTCTATPSDGTDSGAAVASDVVTIANTPPKVTTATLGPTSVYTDTTVVASVTTSDADGDSVSVSYAWTVSGVGVSATTGSLAGSYFEKGDTVGLTVTPDDGDDVGTALTASSVTVLDSPPTAPVVEIDPADPEEGIDDLLCGIVTASSDADGDAITYAAAWEVDGVAFSGVLSSSWPGDTVPFTATAARESWQCEMTPTAGGVSGTAGVATVTVLGEEIDWGNTQWPCSASAKAGASVNLYGWVYHAGVTTGSGQGAGIAAEAGVGPAGSDPATSTAWTWVATSYNGDKDGLSALANDEYWGIVTAPSTAGDYDYAFRYSTDGGLSWRYADLGESCGGAGTDDGYSTSTAGSLTVTP
jgi:hypothetical protein